jgi:hypothetical protein
MIFAKANPRDPLPDVGDDGSYAVYLVWAAKQPGLADSDFLGAAASAHDPRDRAECVAAGGPLVTLSVVGGVWPLVVPVSGPTVAVVVTVAVRGLRRHAGAGA